MDNFLNNFIETNNLNELCCKLNQYQTHFINEPIKLPCNNDICLKCYKKCTKQTTTTEQHTTKFKCFLCSFEHKKNEYESVKNFKADLENVLLKFKEKLSIFSNDLKDKLLNGENIIETYVEFLREEVFIHAEKIKGEIEKTYENFIQQLETYKNEIKKELSELKLLFDHHQDQLEQDHENITIIENSTETSVIAQSNNDLLLRNLNKCETYLNELRAFDSQFYSTINSIDFKPITTHVSFSFGKLKRHAPLRIHNWQEPKLIKTIKLSPVILIECICLLRDDRLLISDSYSGNLFVLNKHFQIIQHMSEVEKYKFKHPCELAFDGLDTIYVNDQGNRSIALIDKNFKSLRSSISSIDACDIASYGGFLYVIGEERVRNLENSRESYLKKYSRTGTLVSKLFTIPVDAQHSFPLKISVNSWLIAIMAVLNGVNMVNIYDLSGNFKNNFNLFGVENFFLNDTHLFLLDSDFALKLYDIKEYGVCYNNSFSASQLVWKGSLLHTSMIIFEQKFIMSNDFNGLLVFG